jgi:hypothetical protein
MEIDHVYQYLIINFILLLTLILAQISRISTEPLYLLLKQQFLYIQTFQFLSDSFYHAVSIRFKTQSVAVFQFHFKKHVYIAIFLIKRRICKSVNILNTN